MIRRRVAVALLALPALAGCAAGRNAQTINTDTVSDAAGADVGQLQVRNVYLAAPETALHGKGGDAPLYLTVASRSDQPDLLTSVTSDDATAVVVRQPDFGGGEASPAASPNAGSPTLAGGSSFPLAVPAGSALQLGPDSTHLVLQGLKRQLRSGQSVRVTFSFANAGSTTLIVPVQLQEGGSAG